MAGVLLAVDPISEDASNVELALNDGTKFRLMMIDFPTPERAMTWATSADTEGDIPASLRYQNRQIPAEARIYGSSMEDALTQIGKLEQKVAKINREGGTLKYTTSSGQNIVFDLVEAVADITQDNAFLANFRTVVKITFVARPFGRGEESANTEHKEETLPCLIFVDAAPDGDVPALGKLVVNELTGADQWTLIWGIQSRNYDSSASAELFYQAETRTRLSTATLSSAAGGASGSGSNSVLLSSLLPSYQGVVSTTSSGGVHLSHVGTYRMFARCYRPEGNSGEVSVALEWGQGDFLRKTRNEPANYLADELENGWTIADLGLVHLDEVTSGVQQWEGQIIAKSTHSGDSIYIDCFMLFPVDEGYGELKISPIPETPVSILGHDEFEQTAGALAGKVAPSGQTWAEAGSAKGTFNLDTSGHTIQRTALSDSESEGRHALFGTTEYTTVAVQATILIPHVPTAFGFRRYGVFARYASTINHLRAQVYPYDSENKRWWWNVGRGYAFNYAGGPVPFDMGGVPTDLRLIVTSTGYWQFWIAGILVSAGFETALAPGGLLEKGKTGIVDEHTSGYATTRTYDNFLLYTPGPFDAAVFSKKSAEVKWDRMQRQDSAGTLWTPRTDYKGSYLHVPPAGLEGRQMRTIVKMSRNNIDIGKDPNIDDLSARIYTQPRYLVIPEP